MNEYDRNIVSLLSKLFTNVIFQIDRMNTRATLQDKVDVLMGNLTEMIEKIGTEEYDSDLAVELLDK